MRKYRIETTNTIWEFDLDRMVYIRIPKSESTEHPMAWCGAKAYEGREVAFYNIKLIGEPDRDGMQHFCVFNTGVKWGEGACTQTWAIPDQDLSWVLTLGEQ